MAGTDCRPIVGVRSWAAGPCSGAVRSIDWLRSRTHTLTLAETRMDSSSPQAVYRAEKAKALRERRISHVQLMAEAQEAFKKLLADAAIARKGGRPKSTPTAPGAAGKPAPAKPVVAKPGVAPAKEAIAAAVPVVAKPVAKPAEKAPETPQAKASPKTAPAKAAPERAATSKPKPPVRAKAPASAAKSAKAPAKATKGRTAQATRVRAKTVAKKHAPVKAGARSTIRKKR